jgi:hypothetical protein
MILRIYSRLTSSSFGTNVAADDLGESGLNGKSVEDMDVRPLTSLELFVRDAPQ